MCSSWILFEPRALERSYKYLIKVFKRLVSGGSGRQEESKDERTPKARRVGATTTLCRVGKQSLVSPTGVLGGIRRQSGTHITNSTCFFHKNTPSCILRPVAHTMALAQQPPLTETRLGENQGTCIAPRLDTPWQKPGLPERLENQRHAAG